MRLLRYNAFARSERRKEKVVSRLMDQASAHRWRQILVDNTGNVRQNLSDGRSKLLRGLTIVVALEADPSKTQTMNIPAGAILLLPAAIDTDQSIVNCDIQGELVIIPTDDNSTYSPPKTKPPFFAILREWQKNKNQ